MAGSIRAVGRSVGSTIAGPSPLALDPALGKALQGYTPDEVRAALESLHKASGGYITDPTTDPMKNRPIHVAESGGVSDSDSTT